MEKNKIETIKIHTVLPRLSTKMSSFLVFIWNKIQHFYSSHSHTLSCYRTENKNHFFSQIC